MRPFIFPLARPSGFKFLDKERLKAYVLAYVTEVNINGDTYCNGSKKTIIQPC